MLCRRKITKSFVRLQILAICFIILFGLKVLLITQALPKLSEMAD